MSNYKSSYTHSMGKLSLLVEQETEVAKKLRGIGLEKQSSQKARNDAAEDVETARAQYIRGNLPDEQLAAAGLVAADAQSAADSLLDDERACRRALTQLRDEIKGARNATAESLQALCFDLADQMGKPVMDDKKLRAIMVNIFCAYRATIDRSLGGSFGGQVNWGGVLEGLFPLPTDAELEAAYGRFILQLK